MSESKKYQPTASIKGSKFKPRPVTKIIQEDNKEPVAPEEEKKMSETRKYQPTASIKRSKREPRTVTAKGTVYKVYQYSITRENFLKLCRELKEYGMENVRYINFDVWEAVADDLNTEPDKPEELPF